MEPATLARSDPEPSIVTLAFFARPHGISNEIWLRLRISKWICRFRHDPPPTVTFSGRVRRRCISLRDLADVSSRRLVDVSDVGHGAAYLGCDRPPFGEEREAVSRLLDLAALTPLVGDLPPPQRART